MPSLCVFAPATKDLSEQPRTGAAQRRKQRRLRSWWRHEQQSIAAALATSRGQRKARAGEEESDVHHTAEVRTTPLPQPVLFSLYDEEPGGRRPASLAEPPGPQERVQRHTMEHIVVFVCCSPHVADSRRSCAADGGTAARRAQVLRWRSFLVPFRLSKCPRSCLETSLCARFCVTRSW